MKIFKIAEDQWINGDNFTKFLIRISWDRKMYLLNIDFIFKTKTKDKEQLTLSPIGQTELLNDMGLDLDSLSNQEIVNAAAYCGYSEFASAIFKRYKKIWDVSDSGMNIPSFSEFIISLITTESPIKDAEIIAKLTECNKIFTNKLKILLKGEE